MFFFVHSPGPQPPGSTSMKQHHDGSHSRPGHQGTQAASPTSTGPVPITLIPPLCPLTNSPTHRHTAGNSNPGFAVETQGREAPGQCWGDCRKDRGEDSGLLKWYLTCALCGMSMGGRILSCKPWAPVTELQEGTHGMAQGEPQTQKPEVQPGPQKAPLSRGADHPPKQKYPCSLQDASRAPTSHSNHSA